GQPVVGPGEKKAPLGLVIPPGRTVLGHAVAGRLQARRGGSITIGARTLTVDRILVEAGTDEDIRLYTALADAQAILGLPGRISEIKAIDCLCLTSDQDPLGQLRAVLEKALPEGRVLQLRSIADARARQRQMMTRLAGLAGPVVVGAAGVWIAVLAGLNVRERRSELGLWRALGHGSGRIAGLFLGRAALLGAVGAAAGWSLGTALALAAGPRLFPVTAGSLAADGTLLGGAMLFTPAFAALASFLPTALAVAHDPAETLRAD
ncbi:MAG: ABC transporter permease, partial [Verrucomicrobiota bacterium]